MSRFFLLAVLLTLPAWAQEAPFTVQALLQLERISDPQVSPDGTTVAFVVQSVDLDQNEKPQQIYTVPVTGGSPRRISWSGTDNHRPRWSPDSQSMAFISNRSGSSQVWIMQADGSSPRQVTDLSTEADGVLYSPDSENLLFTSAVYPGCLDMECNARRVAAERADPVKIRAYNHLLYRHWNEWDNNRRTHIFVVGVAGGEVRDLTPGDWDAPPFSLGGPDDYAVSPDGKELCYIIKPDPVPAVSTNSELYVVRISGGEPVRLTSTPGADNSPLYSPDGNYLAWRSQMRGGFESDRWRLALMRRKPIEYPDAAEEPAMRAPRPPVGRPPEADPEGEEAEEEEERPLWEWDLASISILTDGLDRSVSGFTWSTDSTRLFFTSEDRGLSAIQWISVQGGAVRSAVNPAGTLGDQQFTRDGGTLIYTEQTGASPVELFAASAGGGSPLQLTNLNYSVLDRYQLTPYEEFRVEGAGQTPIHGFLLKPPGFRPDERYPVVFLIHGGPQQAWAKSWSYRWNAQVLAAAGYVVVMPNPRGSAGYGQRFTDEVSGDWGGRAYEDIMAVVNHVASLPYVIPDRMAAAGGSYGGYMVNWMMGHTQRFRAFISHAGVFDLASWAMETEELWFPIWEFRGMPWESPDLYRMWSPDRFISDFFTPTLVIAGEQDHRVPYGQSLQLFTALQRQQVDSRLLVFPDEGHWINKPQNTIRWYDEFIGWLDRYLKPPTAFTAPLPAAPESMVVP